MNDLEPGTMVIMVKNDDGTFSPVGMKFGRIIGIHRIKSCNRKETQ